MPIETLPALTCRRCGEPAPTLTRNVCRPCQGTTGELVLWRGPDGFANIASATRANVKRALLTSGTRRSIHRLAANAGWFQPVTWTEGLAWLRSLAH